MKSFITILLISLVMTPAVLAEDTPADQRWFQVEIMIFKNPNIEPDNPEAWPAFPTFEHPEAYLKLEGITEILTSNSDTDENEADQSAVPEEVTEVEPPQSEKGLEAFVALSEFERQMIEQREIIENSRNYELLFHEAWNQPVPGRDAVIPIRIDAGERFGRQSELQGYISLYVERYLHFSTDLHLIEYQKSADPFSIVAEENQSSTGSLSTLNSFGGVSLLNTDVLSNSQITRKSNQFFVSVNSSQMKESRRMRSRQLHYLDNPEFGLLILITPIEVQ
jgi:hypothetical protein